MIVYTHPVSFYDQTEFDLLAGPDGGDPSIWACEGCRCFVISDK